MTTVVRVLADEVWALLSAVPNVNHYRGEVPGAVPLDPDGRVHAYTVLYVGAGRRYAMRSCATPANLDWTFQVTCVGGDDNRALWCIDKVRAALTGVRLAGGALLGEVTDPGPLRRDDDVTPPRFYLPLLYGAHTR